MIKLQKQQNQRIKDIKEDVLDDHKKRKHLMTNDYDEFSLIGINYKFYIQIVDYMFLSCHVRVSE